MPKLAALVMLLVLGACAPALQSRPDASRGESGAALPASVATGDLRLSPERPRPGERVSVTYVPGRTGDLGRHLSLRARIRTPDGVMYNHGVGSRTIAVLERQRDGRYQGSFPLPADVVHAALAVEDREAGWSDSRHGRFWEVLTHEADGRPTLAALMQRLNDHMGRDQRTVLGTAHDMTRFYPDLVQSWSMLAQAERWVLGADSAARLATDHRARLRAFDGELADVGKLPAGEVGHLFWYASNLGEAEAAKRWRSRLLAEHPDHFFAFQERVMELHGTHREDPKQLLTHLEALWDTATGAEPRMMLYMLASGPAAATRDTAAILRWADRHAAENSLARASVAITLATVDGLPEEGIERLRAEIALLDAAPDEARPLGATRAEHRSESAREAAALRATLAAALLSTGREQEGRAALEQAVEVAWNAAWYRSLGEARLAAGDRAGGARAFAAVAADPKTPASAGDSLRLRLELSEEEWRESVDRAHAEMVRRTLQTAQAGTPVDARATGRDGTPLRLAGMLGDTATVIAVWSPYCTYSNAAMPKIKALGEELRQKGVPLVGVTDISRDEGERYLEQKGWSLPALYDTGGEVTGALNSWGTPKYFVLDGRGRLRFAFSSLDDIPRQVAALRTERREAP